MFNVSSYLFWDSPMIGAIQILLFWFIVSVILYFSIGWFFKLTGIEKFLHRFLGHATRIGNDPLPKAVGKYIAIFVFLLFLRSAVEKAGYTEVEKYLNSVVDYLPYLFLAVFVTFLGIQTSRTMYSIVFNAVNFENPKTAVIIGNITVVFFLFFIFAIVINLINTWPIEIIPEYLVRSILIGFVSAASLAFGLAFGLWGKESASEIIREYLDKKDSEDKNLKN
jgi:hypothetical protein